MLMLKLCRRTYLTPLLIKGGTLGQLACPSVWRSAVDSSGLRFKSTAQGRRAFTRVKTTGESAFTLGRGAVAGGAVVGLGALGYYGLGLSSQPGAVDYASLWPQYVRDRIQATYAYFGGSILISTASACAFCTSPTLLNLLAGNSILPLLGTMVLLVGSSWLVQTIEYKPGLGAKQMAWALHSALVGAVLAPICFIGGPVLMKAAWYTAGIVGGLSAVAACAPSDKFLNIGGPLAIGLGIVFASSIGSVFLPPTTTLGAGLTSISLYGGLLLFSGFLLYDTQVIIAKAERMPEHVNYDPVNESLHIYLDTVNIFIRLVNMFAGSNRRK